MIYDIILKKTQSFIITFVPDDSRLYIYSVTGLVVYVRVNRIIDLTVDVGNSIPAIPSRTFVFIRSVCRSCWVWKIKHDHK